MPDPERVPSESQPSPTPPKPRKRVTVLSMGSFWWRVIKESFRHSREPFEHITSLFGIGAGAIVWLLILHQINQEWVDNMIYWTLAIPFAVWLIWLVWGFVKIPHKIYKTDLIVASSGAEAVFDRKTGFRNFSLFFLITAIVLSFFGLLMIKNNEISALKGQVPLAKQEVAPKPKPDVNTSNPPASAVATAPLSTNRTPLQMVSETDSAVGAVSLDDIDAREKAKQKQKALNAKIQAQNNAQQEWSNNLADRYYCLETLYKIMEKEAPLYGDSVSKNVGFFQCLPKTINLDEASNWVGHIGFATHTNVDFIISIVTYDSIDASTKTLRISSSCGNMDLYSAFGRVRDPWRILNLPSYSLGDDQNIAVTNRDEIDEGLQLLLEAQIRGSGIKNTSVTNIVDKKQ